MNWWESDPRYGQPGWTLINSYQGSYFVKAEPRKRKAPSRNIRFAAAKPGDILIHRVKWTERRSVPSPEGFNLANDNHLELGKIAFRLGDGDVKNHTLDRLDKMFAAAIGQRLTYKELIA